MKLRVASAMLWFLAGWVFVGGIAIRLGFGPAVGPIVGAAWAAFVTIDPRDLIWRARIRSVSVGKPAADPITYN